MCLPDTVHWAKGALDMFLPNVTPAGVFQDDEYLGRFRVRKLVGDLHTPHFAVLGGTESYGRFMRRPYPVSVSGRVGLTCRNYGTLNAGMGAYKQILSFDVMSPETRSCVIEAPPILQVENPYFDVHPVRNDRMVRVKRPYRLLFPDVDVAAATFVGHLWRLSDAADRGAALHMARVLRELWLEGMGDLISRINCPVHILHFQSDMAGPKITLPMLNVLRDVAAVHVIPFIDPDYSGFDYPDWDRAVVETMLGQGAHAVAAKVLANAMEQ